MIMYVTARSCRGDLSLPFLVVSEQIALSCLSARRILPQVQQRLSKRTLSFYPAHIQYLPSICSWQTTFAYTWCRQQQFNLVCLVRELLTCERSLSRFSCGEPIVQQTHSQGQTTPFATAESNSLCLDKGQLACGPAPAEQNWTHQWSAAKSFQGSDSWETLQTASLARQLQYHAPTFGQRCPCLPAWFFWNHNALDAFRKFAMLGHMNSCMPYGCFRCV